MNRDKLLLRQVNPGFIQDGEITSQAFRPTSKGQGRLSCYDRDQIAPKQSWKHFTQVLKLRSAGVVAVTVRECQDAGTVAYVDSVGYPEHAVIDFTVVCSRSRWKVVSKQLARVARSRGWKYGPID